MLGQWPCPHAAGTPDTRRDRERGPRAHGGTNWRDDRPLALNWLAQLGNPYVSVAYDPEGRTAIDWGVTGAPETFPIDANGVVVQKYVGPMTMEVWQREFLPLLPAAGEGR